MGFVQVRIEQWMIADGEPPMPRPGSVLAGVGVRVHGEPLPVDDGVPDGVEVRPATGPAVDGTVYAVTGTASDVRTVEAGSVPGQGVQVVGAELVLTAGENRFQVQLDGRAQDVRPGSRVTVTGELVLVGGYEWEAFELPDTRADWLVRHVAGLLDGDVGVDLVRVALGHLTDTDGQAGTSDRSRR